MPDSFTQFAAAHQQTQTPSFTQFASEQPHSQPTQTPEIAPSNRLGAPITTPYDDLIRTSSRKYRVNYDLAHAVMQAESMGDPHALSAAGAYGLFQLMPGFGPARENVASNIDLGVRYLGTLLNDFHGNRQKALAAYNAGPGAVQKYGGVPPFKETMDYISGIEGLLNYAQAHNYAHAINLANNDRKKPAQTAPRRAQSPQNVPVQQAGVGGFFSNAWRGYLDSLHRIAESPMAFMSDLEHGVTQPGGLHNLAADIFGGARAQERLKDKEHKEETTLNRLDEAAQALSFEPINALTRDMRTRGLGAVSGLATTGSSGPEGDRYNKIWHSPNLDFGQKLDLVADEFGFNSPGELKYWASQPGRAQVLAAANPKTPGGKLLQVGLGVHADLARLKLQYPWATGGETFVSTLLDPGYAAPGMALKTAKLLHFFPDTLNALQNASRAGKYGQTIEAVERNAAKFFDHFMRGVNRYTPVIGSRFYNMGKTFGHVGFAAHSMLVDRIMGRSAEMSDIALDGRAYGGLTPQQQQEVEHLIEHPNFPKVTDPRDGHVLSYPEMLAQGYRPLKVEGEDTKVGDYTLRERAEFIRGQQERLEADTVLRDPTQQGKFIMSTIGQDGGVNPTQTSKFAVHRGMFEMPTQVGLHESPMAAATKRSSLHPVPGPHRAFGTIEDVLHGHVGLAQTPLTKLDEQITMAENAMPSAERARHWTAMQRYNDVLDWLTRLRNVGLKTKDGELAVKPVKYGWTNPATGRVENFGIGRAGLDAAQKKVTDYVNQEIQLQANAGTFDINRLPSPFRERAVKNPAMAASDYEDALRREAEAKIWREIERYSMGPDHGYEFRPDRVLSMDPLKGYALHRDVLDAVIDSHPALEKKYLELKKQARPGQRIEVGDSWVDDEWENQNRAYAWWENVNGFVRQGLLTNVFYHPFFNLIPNAVTLGLPPQRIMRAMFGGTPAKMIQDARSIQAVSPKFGRPVFTNPEHLHYILGVPFKDIWARAAGKGIRAHEQAAADIGTKSYLWLSEANRKIVFDFFEDNLVGELVDHLRSKGMDDAAIHTKVREAFTNYGDKNYTERSAAVSNMLMFYQFGKGMMRFFGKMALQHPNYIEAPAQGSRQITEMQGEPQTTPRELVLGKTAQGQPIVTSMPGAIFGMGPTMIDMLYSPALTGDPREEINVAKKLAVTHFTPLVAEISGLAGDEPPEPYNDVTLDLSAPDFQTAIKDAAVNAAARYTPSPLRGFVNSWLTKNPYAAAGAIGPNIYLKMPEAIRSQVYALQSNLQNVSKSPKYPESIRDKAYEYAKRLGDGDLQAVGGAEIYYRLVQSFNRSAFPKAPTLVPKP